jgi:hypothetical protein
MGRDVILDNLQPSPVDKLRAGSPGLKLQANQSPHAALPHPTTQLEFIAMN